MKKIKAALFRRLQVMENQHRFELEREVIERLLGKEGAAEEYLSLISELSRMTGETREEIERRCIETENGNFTD